ncbi:MAG: plasmid pRiA4b ORF-3 family protein [Cyanobacteria bacterium J06621_12]
MINLHQLDQIADQDQAIAALEGFVSELVAEFVTTAEGKAYLQAYPEMREYVGSWIDHLLYFGYAYESVTLPQMTMSNVEAIVTRIFPQKISLLDPAEAETIIPELKAFWQFLKREYQHPQAHKIIKFLKQLQPKFTEIMNDPQNFGIAKIWLTSGMAAGFDMTTEAGIKEFQQQSDRYSTADSTSSGQSIRGLFDELAGLGDKSLSEEHTELAANLRELATEVVSEFPLEVPSALEFQQQLQAEMTQKLAQKMPPVSTRTISKLQMQQISVTEPGSILLDFTALLDFIGNEGIEVGGKRHLIPMKSLARLNQQLAEPLQIDLQRPQQKSYPTIHGLYLLLRATGMGKIARQGKKTRLTLNSAVVKQYLTMNPTEQYFNLLEAWLIRANEEMLGERTSSLSEGFKCLQYWSRMSSQGEKFKDYQAQQNLRYYPEFYNLALMKLFGLVEANYGKPEKGKGWRVKSIKQTDWGKALIQAIFPNADLSLFWEESATSNTKFGQLQPILQPYFPQWQQVITLPNIKSIAGVYIFKVAWHQIWRRIAISSDMTLWDLSQLILQSVDFDSDHLDMFSYKDQLGKTVQVVHPYMEESPSTDETKIADLPLEVGSVMEYLFDFGDNWEFELQLEEIQEELRPSYGKIIAHHGQAPEQYPDWGEY